MDSFSDIIWEKDTGSHGPLNEIQNEHKNEKVKLLYAQTLSSLITREQNRERN